MKRRDLISNGIAGGLGLTLMSKAFAGQYNDKEFGDWLEVPNAGGLHYKMVWTDGKNLARFFKIPADYPFAHSHPEGEYTFFVSGKITIDGKLYEAGDEMYMPPGSCHSGYTPKDQECVVFTFHREELVPHSPVEGCPSK